MAGTSSPSATVSRCTCEGQSGTALNCGWEVYLTFDDGPGVGTFEVLDVLDAHKVPGTFLLTGTNFTKRYDREEDAARVRDAFAALKLADDWHLIGNHSWTHDFGLYRTPEKMAEDFQANESIVEYEYQTRGEAYLPADFTHYGRLPGCNTWRVDMDDEAQRIDLTYDELANVAGNGETANLLANTSYEIYGWDLDWHGYDDGDPETNKQIEKLRTADSMLEEAYARLERGFAPTESFETGVPPEGLRRARKLVVLGHDRTFANGGAQQLDDFIRQLKECATFKTLRAY